MSGDRLPQLSVVVPSVNGWQDLRECLSALEAERGPGGERMDLEVIVPERCGETVRDLVARDFSWARVLPVSDTTTIPQMRALAMDAATAPVIAVIEDHVIVPSGWAFSMRDACTGDVRVVAGTLVNAATQRTVDWAAFLCEYSHVLTELTPGPADWLMGNNAAYTRELLDEFREAVHAGRWENVLHDVMRSRGIVLWRRPDIVVGHKKHYTVAEYTSQRFLYARAYAADRVASTSAAGRVMYGLAAFALPPLLYARVVSRIWSSGKHRRELRRSLPLLTLLVIAWGLGEVVGAWRGDGGALAKVR